MSFPALPHSASICPALPCSALSCPCLLCLATPCPAFQQSSVWSPSHQDGIHKGLGKQQGISCVQGHLLGIQGTFLRPVAQVAIDLSHGCDPAVLKNADRILRELQLEEERFSATLGTGQKLLTDILQVSKLSFPLTLTVHDSRVHMCSPIRHACRLAAASLCLRVKHLVRYTTSIKRHHHLQRLMSNNRALSQFHYFLHQAGVILPFLPLHEHAFLTSFHRSKLQLLVHRQQASSQAQARGASPV